MVRSILGKRIREGLFGKPTENRKEEAPITEVTEITENDEAATENEVVKTTATENSETLEK